MIQRIESSMSPSPRRVVITGLGIITPVGNSPTSLWEALSSGRSGVAPLRTVPTTYLPTSFAAEAHEFTGSIDDFGPLEGEKKKALRKGLKVMCRECQMGLAAAQKALASAGWNNGGFDPERSGVVFGSDYMLTLPEDFTAGVVRSRGADGKFDFGRWPSEGMPQLTPLWLLKYLPNMPASHLAIYNDMRGPNNSLTLREASSNLAIGEAFRTIARGHADMMVAGATGTRVHPMKMVHTLTQEQVAGNGSDPAAASRPFDLNRSGMVLGEGAGSIVLEELSTARARSARIYGEVIGTASGTAIDRQGIANRGLALANVMRAALRDAGLSPDDVGHVHAHGLSTQSSDVEESWAIGEVFGARAKTLPIAAAKSYFGNLGAASGLVELVASLLSFEHGRLFPVLNYQTPDPACPVNVVRSADVLPGKTVLNVNFTPQGQASAVVVRAFEG
jgi:3-oxoacyl-[acyl-carrier-protein] synthase II